MFKCICNLKCDWLRLNGVNVFVSCLCMHRMICMYRMTPSSNNTPDAHFTQLRFEAPQASVIYLYISY